MSSAILQPDLFDGAALRPGQSWFRRTCLRQAFALSDDKRVNEFVEEGVIPVAFDLSLWPQGARSVLDLPGGHRFLLVVPRVSAEAASQALQLGVPSAPILAALQGTEKDVNYGKLLPSWSHFSLYRLANLWHVSRNHVDNLRSAGAFADRQFNVQPPSRRHDALGRPRNAFRIPRAAVLNFLQQREIK